MSAAVEKRSYSLYSRTTSDEVVTWIAGAVSRAIAAARSSSAPSRYEWRKQMAIASTPAAAHASTAVRTSSSFSAIAGSPLTNRRWRTSKRSGRATSGAGLASFMS